MIKNKLVAILALIPFIIIILPIIFFASVIIYSIFFDPGAYGLSAFYFSFLFSIVVLILIIFLIFKYIVLNESFGENQIKNENAYPEDLKCKSCGVVYPSRYYFEKKDICMECLKKQKTDTNNITIE